MQFALKVFENKEECFSDAAKLYEAHESGDWSSAGSALGDFTKITLLAPTAA